MTTHPERTINTLRPEGYGSLSAKEFWELKAMTFQHPKYPRIIDKEAGCFTWVHPKGGWIRWNLSTLERSPVPERIPWEALHTPTGDGFWAEDHLGYVYPMAGLLCKSHWSAENFTPKYMRKLAKHVKKDLDTIMKAYHSGEVE